MSNTKVIVIGLDGATFDVILPWIEENKLPALASVYRNGARSRFCSTPNIHSASGWTSIITGRNPGKHGIYYFFERDFATGRMRYFIGADRKGKAIWHYLNEAGKSVGLINVPMTYPAEPVNGFIIAGCDAPSINSGGFAYPPSLAKEILSISKNYTIAPDTAQLLRGENKLLAVEKWIEAIEARVTVAERLYRKNPVDFFMVVFTASDWVQHKFWKYFDPAHPDYTEEGARRYGIAIQRIFEKLDEAVGRLLALADTETNIFIVSDHGFGLRHAAKHFLPGWLVQQGLMNYKYDITAGHLPRSRSSKALQTVAGRMQQLSRGALKKIAPSLFAETSANSRKEALFSAIDWSRTKAYVEFDNLHSIWINLKGRNPHGIVSPGQEYEQLRQHIIALLYQWTDASGNRVVERAFKREEIYNGPYTDRAPDIQIWWSDGAMAGVAVNSETAPTLVKEEAWSGNHRLEGILMMQGPQLGRSRWISRSSVTDVVPTVLHLFGLPVAEDIDGKILFEALEQVSITETAPATTVADSISDQQVILTKSDEELIRERLESLGYL